VTNIDFIYFDAGGGHRAAATALKTVIEQQDRPWNVRLVNLQEVLHSLDIFRKLTGIRLEDIYNLMLAKGWTLGSAEGLMFIHGVIRLYHGSTTKLLSRHWLESKPDLVVSLVPNFNRTMYQALRAALPQVPYVTILTDFADHPPHFWMEPHQEQFFICGTAKAADQARALGHAENRIFRTSGMILRPTFYQPVTADRALERARLGLDPDKPTGLVLFGGQGSKVMIDIDRLLDDTQLIFICGKNKSLAENLHQPPRRAKRFIEGFTSEIPYYMHLSDFFIGKPGPGSISEAVAMKLPVIVERNLWTLVQERYNADWVLEHGAGLVLPHFGNVQDAVNKLLGSLDEYRANVAKIENRAVFEIVDILDSILRT
jgi:UDP-N-acetylglucosamine:LPS N-acetylglucosamine transferase